MSSRKRKRSQAFLDEHQELEAIGLSEGQADPKDLAEKEAEIWDAIREERYEIVEQLPLTLHRQLSLMHQLDEQSQSYILNLLPMLRKYIELRRNIVRSMDPENNEIASAMPHSSVENAMFPLASTGENNRQRSHIPKSGGQIFDAGANASNAPTPITIPIERAKVPQTSRDYLSHIAWFSEEILRASQEKVNLAQATNDSVERHIRLLDLAIQEQEASLAASSEGSIHLPDLTLPKPNRASTNASDIYSLQTNCVFNDRTDDDEGGETPVDERELPSGLLKTLFGTPTKNDAGEELYCYCNRVSFGEMIACDGPHCSIEWFHLGCVGLTETPEGEWYCENCTKFEM